MNPASPAQHTRPLWIATLVTAILTPLGYFLALFLASALRGEMSAELLFRSLGFIVFFGLIPTLAAMYLVGLPLVMLLRSQRLLTAAYVIGGAAVAGVLTMVALVTLVARSPLEVEVFGWGIGLGLLAGLVFCVAAGIPFRKPLA